MVVSQQALALLDLIEAIEMRSLEWGFTDGSLSEDEAFALADCANGEDERIGDGEELIEELIGTKLIFELQSVGSGVRIRSRFAEMMRLLAANRQLFPNRPWQGAPHLVADFRVRSQAPTFPAARRLVVRRYGGPRRRYRTVGTGARSVAGTDLPTTNEPCRLPGPGSDAIIHTN